ncbi:MAG: hypothetical protein ACKO9Q_30555, partial [Pirellula sp.]
AQVTGLGYSRMNVGLLELNDQLSIVSTDSNGIGQFDVTQNLSGLDGNLLIQGDTFVTIASGTGFEGSILASQASLNVRGDLSDASIHSFNGSSLYVETNASLGSVTVDSGATLYPAQGDTFYSQVTLGAGG